MSRYINKIIEYGLYLLIFLLPWQTRWIWHQGFLAGEKWEYGTFSLYGIDIIIVILFILSIFVSFKQPKGMEKFWVLIGGFFVIGFFSIFSSSNKDLAWYAATKLMEGIALLWIILRTSFSWQKLSLAFVAGGVIQALLGIYQFFSQSSPASKWLGLASLSPADLNGVAIIENSSGRWLRAYGSLPHPNILGGYLVVCLLVLVGLIIYLHRERLVKWWSVVLYTLSFCAMFLGLVFTFSRSAWLAFAVSFIGIIIFSIWQREKRLQKILFRISVWLVLLVMTTGVMFPFLWQTRLSGNGRLEEKSTTLRVSYYRQAAGLISENWLQGIGLGNYTQAVYNRDTSQNAWDYQPVHNIYVLVITEVGVFGGLVFILIIAEFVRSSSLVIISRKRELDQWFLVFTSIFFSLLIIGLFDHYLWTLSFGILLFWLVFGLWAKQWLEQRRENFFGNIIDNIFHPNH